MSILEDLGRNIPSEIKANIPFYENASELNSRIKDHFKFEKIVYSYLLDNRYDQYTEKIKSFKNLHQGNRCFIIATGPSLKKTNLKLIKDEIIIGVNTLYRGLKKFGLKCDYYFVSDPNVWKEHSKKILECDTNLFIGSLSGRDYLDNKESYEKIQKNEPMPIRTSGVLRSSDWKIKDLSIGTYSCHQIIAAMALQGAYYMGFDEVYLLGCDCDYSGGSHHFNDENYSFQSKSSQKSEKYWTETFYEYDLIRKGFEKDKRKVYNSTVGGKLEVFERKKLEDIFKK